MGRDEFDVLVFFLRTQFRTGDPHGGSHHVYVTETLTHGEKIFRGSLSCQIEIHGSIIVSEIFATSPAAQCLKYGRNMAPQAPKLAVMVATMRSQASTQTIKIFNYSLTSKWFSIKKSLVPSEIELRTKQG